MPQKNPSQRVLVLKHLLRYGSITDKVARDKYGITRLAARIEDLRYRYPFADIDTEMVGFKTRLDRKGRFAKYVAPANIDRARCHEWIKSQTEVK